MASSSFLYGKGVFTTVAICGGEPMFWDAHQHRIWHNAKIVGIDLDKVDPASLLTDLRQRIDQQNCVDGKARITFLDESNSDIWPGNEVADQPIRLHIMTAERRSLPREFRLSTSPYPINSRSPLAGVKSCNYLEPIMSLDEAKGRGFHEAIRVNERGFVTSACMANVFWLKGGELFTPSLATGCLAGTTREFVLENIDCCEVEVGIEALDDAEAIFLTSAGIGVVRVAEFEGRRLERVDHPIMHLLPF